VTPASITRLGLIAGNGRFPFLLLDAARAHGVEVVVAAIKEETEPEMDARAAADPGSTSENTPDFGLMRAPSVNSKSMRSFSDSIAEK